MFYFLKYIYSVWNAMIKIIYLFELSWFIVLFHKWNLTNFSISFSISTRPMTRDHQYLMTQEEIPKALYFPYRWSRGKEDKTVGWVLAFSQGLCGF